jgi:t-SNARE complex subunit (syntaxin)
MNNEQIERNLEAIVAQMARFADNVALHESNFIQIENNMAKVTDVILSIANVAQRHEEEIAALDKELKTRQSEWAAGMKELREAGKETDARLNALILMFERSLGKAKPDAPPETSQ